MHCVRKKASVLHKYHLAGEMDCELDCELDCKLDYELELADKQSVILSRQMPD